MTLNDVLPEKNSPNLTINEAYAATGHAVGEDSHTEYQLTPCSAYIA